MAEEPKTSPPDKPAEPTLHVSPGPHLQDTRLTTRRMMLDVLIALVPVVAASVVFFRQYAVLQIVACVAGCVIAETVFSLMRGRKPTLGDLSAVVTGVILAMSLPWNCPWWVSAIGGVVAIGLGKAIFGGVGFNLFNPAMVGRAFVMLAFTFALGASAYVADLDRMGWLEGLDATPAQYVIAEGADAATSATPMTAIKNGHQSSKLLPLLLGNTVGSLGETSALACLIGGIYLVLRRTASWEIPLGVLLAVGVIAGILYAVDPAEAWTPAHTLLGGALLFGAFFIATDPVSSPLTPKGKFLFGLGVGVLIMLIRRLSGYPEGVMFAVLLMNGIAPLMNRWTVPKPFGGLPKKPAVAK